MKRALGRAPNLIVDAFEVALPYIDWACFLFGLLGAVATATGLAPPYTDSLWAKITQTVAFVLLAREGFEGIVDRRAGAEG